MISIKKENHFAVLRYRLLRMIEYHEAWVSGNLHLVIDVWEEALDDLALGKMIVRYHRSASFLRECRDPNLMDAYGSNTAD